MSDNEERLEQSWRDNAAAWTDAVRGGLIPSRRAGTDRAIIDTIVELGPHRLLDAGCGEGWLSRAIAGRNVEVVGFDGSAALIEQARTTGGATFLHLSYEAFIAEPMRAGSDFDVVVFNFSLFTQDLVAILRASKRPLRKDGALVIQTVHPFNDSRNEAYQDGWREETFAAMGSDFRTPMPWYFRTMGSWLNSVIEAGYRIKKVTEPYNAEAGTPLSLILTAIAQD